MRRVAFPARVRIVRHRRHLPDLDGRSPLRRGVDRVEFPATSFAVCALSVTPDNSHSHLTNSAIHC
ncbi:hypothetical protein RHRU231_560120 [Rhodococcus ruber]|uniref:Uncharacterized protein n=1 Tax=Rhodococcus ruber TaxID=1830 RepID=A0A098BQ61_9NOCA|nr:hypothetical protein RHRU231_560120 [Rhodococcus ruber]